MFERQRRNANRSFRGLGDIAPVTTTSGIDFSKILTSGMSVYEAVAARKAAEKAAKKQAEIEATIARQKEADLARSGIMERMTQGASGIATSPTTWILAGGAALLGVMLYMRPTGTPSKKAA